MIPSETTAPTIARRQSDFWSPWIQARLSQDLPLGRLATAAAASVSQRCRSLRIDGHFSAHGIPKTRSAVHTPLGVRSDPPMTSVSSAISLRGTQVLRRVRVADLRRPSARDSGLPSKRHWPQRGRGMGDAPGPTTGRSPRESASAAREQSRRTVLVSVGFSTPRQRTETVCPPRNGIQSGIAFNYLANYRLSLARSPLCLELGFFAVTLRTFADVDA
jgi:hypothetical protein